MIMKNIILLIGIATIGLLSCTELEDPLLIKDVNETIRIEVVNDNLEANESLKLVLADSLSSRLISIRLEERADLTEPITISTTRGVLAKAGEPIDLNSKNSLTLTTSGRQILLQLYALNVPDSTVIVSGTIGDATNVISLNFIPSYPDQIQVSPTSVNTTINDTITIGLSAFTASGIVSENIKCSVSVNAPDSLMLNYPSILKLKDGKASFELSNVSKKNGKAEVIVKSPKKGSLDSLERRIIVVYNQ
jgi:hypothetical protein